MSDDTPKPVGLELHVNLTHPELQDRHGHPDGAKVRRLLEFLPPIIGYCIKNERVPEKGAVLNPEGRPLAYWVYTYKDVPTATEED